MIRRILIRCAICPLVSAQLWALDNRGGGSVLGLARAWVVPSHREAGSPRRPPWPTPKPPLSTLLRHRPHPAQLRHGSADLRRLGLRPRHQLVERQATPSREVRNVRWMEQEGRMASTIGRRLSTLSSFYKYCQTEDILDKNPALNVRRPKVHDESRTLGLDRNELGALLVQATSTTCPPSAGTAPWRSCVRAASTSPSPSHPAPDEHSTSSSPEQPVPAEPLDVRVHL